MEWRDFLAALSIPSVAATLGGAWFVFRGKRGENKNTAAANRNAAIGDRWDDASELATKMRDYITAEVERQVKPIRDELAQVKTESHEMTVAVRSREVQLWMWNIQGRAGRMPELPHAILNKLGIGHLISYDDLDDTIRVSDKE